MSNITDNTEKLVDNEIIEKDDNFKKIDEEISSDNTKSADLETEASAEAEIKKSSAEIKPKRKKGTQQSKKRSSGSKKHSGSSKKKRTKAPAAKNKRRKKRKKDQNGAAIIAISACLVMLALLLFSVAVLMGFMGNIVKVEQLSNSITINLMNKANKRTVADYIKKTSEISSLNNTYTEIINSYLGGGELDIAKLKGCKATITTLRESCKTQYINLQDYQNSCMAVLDDLDSIGDEFISLENIKYYKIDNETAERINTLIKEKDASFSEMSDSLTRTFDANGITYNMTEDGTISYNLK